MESKGGIFDQSLASIRVGNAYISKTEEITSFLALLSDHLGKLPPTIRISSTLDILNPDYFEKRGADKLHSWWGNSPTKKDVQITHEVHPDQFSILVLKIFNLNDWKQFTNQFFQWHRRLEAHRTLSDIYPYFSHLVVKSYKKSKIIQTPEYGLRLNSENRCLYDICERIMARLTIRDFVLLSSDINYDKEDLDFTCDSMLEKTSNLQDKYVIQKIPAVYEEVPEMIEIRVLSIDLLKSQNCLFTIIQHLVSEK